MVWLSEGLINTEEAGILFIFYFYFSVMKLFCEGFIQMKRRIENLKVKLSNQKFVKIC